VFFCENPFSLEKEKGFSRSPEKNRMGVFVFTKGSADALIFGIQEKGFSAH